MKRKIIVCFVVSMIFTIFFSVKALAREEYTVLNDEQHVKKLVEEYISKYDEMFITSETKNISKVDFGGLIASNQKSLNNYLEKKSSLIIKRRKAFGLTVTQKSYTINYNKISFNKSLCSVDVTVSGEVQFSTLDCPSYYATDHKIIFQFIKNGYFIIDDITNDEIDIEARKLSLVEMNDEEDSTENNSLSIDELIQQDNRVIQDQEAFERNRLRQSSEFFAQKNLDTKGTGLSLNVTNMKNYATMYWNNYNTNYGNFASMGGDCTNFTSQIIRAGGAPMRVSSTGWYYNRMSARANWTGAQLFYDFAMNNTLKGPYIANVYLDWTQNGLNRPYYDLPGTGRWINIKYNT